MDTGVAPAGVDEPPAINFGARKKECQIPRITGTQWEESHQDEARDLWENLGREEDPAFLANEGQFEY